MTPTWSSSHPLIVRLIAEGVTADLAAEIAERAAIIEYDGRVDRVTAERMAVGE
jgi:hypothetical protein